MAAAATAVLVLFALLPLCGGMPGALAGYGASGFGGGPGQGRAMEFSRAMMGMASHMMRMASQVARAASRPPLNPGSLLRPQAAWAPLPAGTKPPGALLDMLPPPPPPLGVAPLGEQMGGMFVGEYSPKDQSHAGGKSAGEAMPKSFGMGEAPPPGGSSQLHLMEKLHGPPKDSGMTTPGATVAPVGVGADYSYFASKLAAGISGSGPDPMDHHSAPISGMAHMPLNASGPGSQQAKDLHYHDALADPGTSSPKPGQKLDPTLYTPPPPIHIGPPTAEQLLMSNLFVTGTDKATDHKQVVPEPLVHANENGGLGPIPGLTAPLYTGSNAASNKADMALRAPCDLLVDAVFALDDMKNLWLAREAIRYYETQLLPSKKTRFGVVLCGQQKSFYTALHQHFSALLASLEDLQHANATLEPAQHMPDTPGHRSENNPYPPRVSEDFAQIDAGCLETAYHLLTYQSVPNVERLLVVVGTKERWADKVRVEEARFLHSLNISLMATADGKLSTAAQDTLRKMASSPDKFRSVSDNVTMRALPAMIGSAICRPQKADVTATVQRTATGVIQEPVVTECIQIDPVLMRRTMDFGPFFGIHTDHVRCPPGLVPDLRSCACA